MLLVCASPPRSLFPPSPGALLFRRRNALAKGYAGSSSSFRPPVVKQQENGGRIARAHKKKRGQIPSDRTKEGRRGKRAPRSKEWQGPRSIVVTTTLTMAKRCRALQAASRIARGRERKGPASDGPGKSCRRAQRLGFQARSATYPGRWCSEPKRENAQQHGSLREGVGKGKKKKLGRARTAAAKLLGFFRFDKSRKKRTPRSTLVREKLTLPFLLLLSLHVWRVGALFLGFTLLLDLVFFFPDPVRRLAHAGEAGQQRNESEVIRQRVNRERPCRTLFVRNLKVRPAILTACLPLPPLALLGGQRVRDAQRGERMEVGKGASSLSLSLLGKSREGQYGNTQRRTGNWTKEEN